MVDFFTGRWLWVDRVAPVPPEPTTAVRQTVRRMAKRKRVGEKARSEGASVVMDVPGQRLFWPEDRREAS